MFYNFKIYKFSTVRFTVVFHYSWYYCWLISKGKITTVKLGKEIMIFSHTWHRVLNSVFNLQKTSFDIVAVPNQRNIKHSCLHILNIQQDNVCIISQIALSTCCSWKRLHYSLCNKQVKDDCKNKQQKNDILVNIQQNPSILYLINKDS